MSEGNKHQRNDGGNAGRSTESSYANEFNYYSECGKICITILFIRFELILIKVGLKKYAKRVVISL